MGRARLGKTGYPDPTLRFAWLDLLKVVSAFAVVMTHVASIGWQAMPPTSEGWFVTSVYEIATRFCVPAFFMASGALLLNPRKRVDAGLLWRGRIPRMALLALGTSLAYALLERALGGWQGWRSVVVATLDGPYFIWYLWVLVGLYALTPLLRPVAERARLLAYAVGVLAFFVLGRSTVDAMLPDSWLALWLDNFILFAPGMEGVFYYLLGALLVIWRPSRRVGAAVVVAGACALVLAVALNYASALTVGPDLYYVNRDNLLIAAYSSGVFGLFRWCGPRGQTGLPLRHLTSLGLAVYLAHPFLRLVMERTPAGAPLVHWLLEMPLIAIPVVSVLLWGLSVFISWAVGRALLGAQDAFGT